METVEDKLRRNTLLKMLRADYQEISRAAPGTAPGHCALGRLALMNNRQGVALKQFTLALKMDPSMPQAHAGLALLYGGAEQRQKSARHSEEALRRVPDQFTKRLLNRLLRNFSTKMKPLSECHRGLRLYEEARHDKALAKFELAADGFRKEGNEGEELRCRYYMALCYWELDRQQECLRLLRRTLARLIELKNELAVIVRGRLGLLLVQSGRWGEAVEVLPAVVGDYLDRREFLVAARQSSHLVYALLMLGEVEDARKKMDAAVELSAKYGRRDDLIVWTDAVLLRYEGRPEKALLLYVLLAHRHRRNLGRKLSYQLGSVSCLIENDKLDLAERRARSIEEAARKQDLLPQLLNAQRKQMAILRRRGLLKQALSLAIKTSSMGAQIDLQVGILAHIQGDNEVARRYLTRALKSDKGPHYARIYLVLQGLMSGGVGPVARDRYLTAAKEDESWPAPILNYLLGDLSTEELRKKSEKYPVYQMEVAYYLAEQHLANKMPKKAQRLFETCKTARLVDHFEYANSQDRLHQLNRR